MESTFTLLRVRGIPIGINWSWIIVFALIAWSLSAALFPRTYPALDSTTYLVMGLAAAVLFFLSILLHELGHAFQALKEDMEIDGITLWLFGGVARFKGMFPSAGAEFRIAIAGPIVSVLIAGFFAFLNWGGNIFGWPDGFVGVVDYLARINAILVIFNMVPALPLDGGRVLRAWLWHRQKSFSLATASAAKAGRAFGGLLIGLGVLAFITGAGIGGIWFVFLGWFLLQAAQAEASFALIRKALSGLRARDLMTPDPTVVPPELTIAEFLDELARTRGHSTYPVVGYDGRLAGLVSLRLAGQVPVDRRHQVTVREVMLPREEVPVLDGNREIVDALLTLQEGPGRAVVLDGERIEGILSTSDVARALEVEQVRGPEPTIERARTPFVVWLVIAGMFGAAAYLYHPPVAVIAPGEALDVSRDISIDGIDVDALNGDYLLTSVAVRQPNMFGLGMAVLRDEQIVSLAAIVPRDVDPEEFLDMQRELFRESQRIAAAAAAQAAGMDVSISGTGAIVAGVVAGAPAADVLEPGDVITHVEDEPIRIAPDLRRAIQARPVGTRFTLRIERNGLEREVEVLSARIDGVEGDVGIGVFIQTRDFDFDLPFEVTFEEREIGGPSAGLAYALAIYDMIEPTDLAQGRTIATTGTIDIDGRVGEVGGVAEKAEAARRAGAELFLVPAGEVGEARGFGIPVRGVASLLDAIETLTGRA